jgi:hypothetical protein
MLTIFFNLRYCIACEGDRPGEGFAAEFLTNIDLIAGETPVLIIFTKYDRLIGLHYAALARKHRDWSYAETLNFAEGEALKEFEAKYLGKVMAKVDQGTKKRVSPVRVGGVQSPENGGVDIGSLPFHARSNH